jgi:hypothetical protein
MMYESSIFVDYLKTRNQKVLRNAVARSARDDGERRLLWAHLLLRTLQIRDFAAAEFCIESEPSIVTATPLLDGPLHQVLEYAGDRPDLVDWLITSGADLMHRGDNNWTPAHEAAHRDCPGALSLLLDRGVNPDIGTEIDGDRSPLLVAAAAGALWCVVALVNRGADVRRIDNMMNESARELAHRAGHEEIADLLDALQRGRV